MDQQLLLLVVLSGVSVFMVVMGITLPQKRKDQVNVASTHQQFRSRSVGRGKAFEGIAEAGVRRALRRDTVNARYLRWLKQANWYWEVGEPTPPNAKAAFWNVETMWSEKFIGLITWGVGGFLICVILGVFLAMFGMASLTVALVIGLFVGGLLGFMAYSMPDSQVGGAASARQKELSLEMGFRVPELRADVLSGATIQRAMRSMSRRPGGSFVEELRRAVTVLDVTRDEAQAMDYLMDRSQGNELMMEFANSVKMVSRQGGQIGPVLNTIADLAQEKLRLSISMQARKNLQEMTRPIAISSLIVTTLLIIVPALAGVAGGFVR